MHERIHTGHMKTVRATNIDSLRVNSASYTDRESGWCSIAVAAAAAAAERVGGSWSVRSPGKARGVHTVLPYVSFDGRYHTTTVNNNSATTPFY